MQVTHLFKSSSFDNLKIKYFFFFYTEKLSWIFNLYDIDRDGYISKNEMLLITNAIYEMIGKFFLVILIAYL